MRIEDGDQKKLFRVILVGGVTFGLFLVALGILSVRPSGGPGASSFLPAGRGDLAATEESPFKGIVVPEVDSEVPEGVARPFAVRPASPPDSLEKLRKFAIAINGNAFSPRTVIIYEGDIAQLNFTASDKTYDFYEPSSGMRQTISKGQSKTVFLGAPSSGKFTFFCVRCGGPERGPVGSLIAVPR